MRWVMIVCALLLSSPAFADVRAVDFVVGSARAPALLIENDIESKDVKVLATLLAQSPPRGLLFLNSKGGDAYAAMAMGRLVRKALVFTEVLKGSQCLSSCALIYIASVDRLNDGIIGLHRPYLAGAPLETSQIQSVLPKLFDDVRHYIAEMGITDDFANIMLNTAPENMRSIVGQDILNLVPEKDPGFDELFVSHQARDYGVPTEEYRHRQALADKICLGPQIHDVGACEGPILWNLGWETYQQRSASAADQCKLEDSPQAEMPGRLKFDWDNPIMARHFACVRDVMLAKSPSQAPKQ